MSAPRMKLEWQEPPATDKHREPRIDGTQRERIVKVIKQHPGRWARVQVQMQSYGSANAWRKFGLEAVTRINDDKPGTFDIYVREPADLTEADVEWRPLPERRNGGGPLTDDARKAMGRRAGAKLKSLEEVKAEAGELSTEDAYLLRQRERFEADRQHRAMLARLQAKRGQRPQQRQRAQA